jgi:putative ABC transport system permease protein
MKWRRLLAAAARSILKNRMRSLLTMLGIIIGVAAVIVMVSIGEGAQANIESSISSLGTNLLIVFPGASRSGGVSFGAGSATSLTLDDADLVRQRSTLLAGVSPAVRVGAQVIGGGANWSTLVQGVSPEYLTVRDWALASGSFFTDRDVRGRTKVAVLGKTVADNLFPAQDPVGEEIRIRNVPFKVIGELASKGQTAFGSDQDDIILVPVTTALFRLSGNHNINQIYASATGTGVMDAAAEEIRGILRQAHRLPEGADDDFTIRSQTEIIEAASSTSRTLTLLLGSIAGVSLLVGGIGIMNIMLVSVTERTREIGTRLAVGARESDVLTQFLVEATVLSLAGGLLGVAAGAGIGFALGSLTSLNAPFNPAISLVAFAFSGAVGVFFGFYPARKASSLDPIEALRYE